MDTYDQLSFAISKKLTLTYSTSFGLSSKLFSKDIRQEIYAIYGLVRIADEIVDTYKGQDSKMLLDDLEKEVYRSIKTGYSTNPVVHAYALTARAFDIDETLISPFFASMRVDLEPQNYTQEKFKDYIHGSAEVVGLMCLRVFCQGNKGQYDDLRTGACALGSAYQKVNFLRDFGSDYKVLGRLYFPNVDYNNFDESDKQYIVSDIESDFANALLAINKLPRSCRTAVKISYLYYTELLDILKKTPAEIIKTTRIRVSSPRKLYLFAKTIMLEGTKR